jgi:AcrR family transcriptional regulator
MTPRRADAERNRTKLLDSARALFAAPGDAPSMAEIARHAGVGMATLYRNFPSREALLEALYVDEADAVVAAAETVEGDTAGERFVAWLHHFFAFYNGKHEVGDELLRGADGVPELMDASKHRVLAAGGPLLEAAQAAGDIRADLSLEQALTMVVAVAKIPGDPDFLAPILQTTLDGLRRV